MKTPLQWLAPFEVCPETTTSGFRGNKQNFYLRIDYGNFSGMEKTSQLPDQIEERLAYGDLQRGIGASLERSLGSGRSCFYRGGYYKGIGRTPLVKSWTDSHHYLHSNGLLYPSAAVRELVFSQYVPDDKKGCINPVTDLFLIPGTPYSQKVLDQIYIQANHKIGKIERQYVAQTRKEGNFIRFSNLKWAYSNMGVRFMNENDFSNLRHFVSALSHGLSLKTQDQDVASYEGDPRSLFEKLFASSVKSISHVIQLNCAGIKLGSLGNNFTLDGRFLDLEVPVFVGSNQLTIHLPDVKHSVAEIFECLGALFQCREYLDDFSWWMTQAQAQSTHSPSKGLLKKMSEEFQQTRDEFGWLWDDAKVIDFITRSYQNEKIQLSSQAKLLIQLSLKRPYLQLGRGELGESERIDFPFAQYQIGIYPECYRLSRLIESAEAPDLQKAAAANDYLRKLDEFEQVEDVLKNLP